jgi:hypothetical protein
MIIPFPVEEFAPQPVEVLQFQGIPATATVPTSTRRLLDEASGEAVRLARPRALLEEVSPSEFARVFDGEGRNAVPNPIALIHPRATVLALFALTLGGEISERIRVAFLDKDYPFGFMLDSVASVMADKVADGVQARFQGSLSSPSVGRSRLAAQRYSPGYCGWHLTGQRKLFARLDPKRIGITLGDGCLMTPIKSVSGVILVGPAEIHLFDNEFDFCLQCRTKSCRARMRALIREMDGRQYWRVGPSTKAITARSDE